MRVFLVGFMGSGKSTLGKALAQNFMLKFIDLDEFIQKSTGLTITEMFQAKGEPYFRQIEADLLRRIEEKNVVVSTGGGCPVHHGNMGWINSNGISIYLKITPYAAFQRLKDTRSKRPLIASLSEKDLLPWIEDQMKQREEFYAKANYSLKEYEANVETVEDLIQSR